MKILQAQQVRDWDAYTLAKEPIASIDLMERAAQSCTDWLMQWKDAPACKIFCGKGNNGGDGLAMARQLTGKGRSVEVFILESGKPGSPDFQQNLQRLREYAVPIHYIQSEAHFPLFSPDDWIIDALFGTGLNAPPIGITAELIGWLNASGNGIISIDLPSGLFADAPSPHDAIIRARHTLTFQVPKWALLVAENGAFTGAVHVLDIGLHPGYLQETNIPDEWLEEHYIQSLYKKRSRFAHKGTFGHALLVGGSFGKMGALVLAVNACLRSGAGLVSAYAPGCGYNILQVSAPEAMALVDTEQGELVHLPPQPERFTVLGIGTGMGTGERTVALVGQLVGGQQKPVVLDADGLNCLSRIPDGLDRLPLHSILTPHPREFERLFGPQQSEFDRIRTAREQASARNLILIVKGHHTVIALPDGRLFVNSTGNAGMAKGGSGDVLTGILTSLLAQGYEPSAAALFGVYLHGLSGDYAARSLGQEVMTASDLISSLAPAFQQLRSV